MVIVVQNFNGEHDGVAFMRTTKMSFSAVYTYYDNLWNEKGVDVHWTLIVVGALEKQETR